MLGAYNAKLVNDKGPTFGVANADNYVWFVLETAFLEICVNNKGERLRQTFNDPEEA